MSLQKAKAQHSVLSTNLHRQGYREAKLHVIFVEVMKTIYKDSTDQPLAGLNLDHHKIENQTHKLNKHSIKHASTLIKTRYALQYNLNNNSQGVVWVPRHTTLLTHTTFFRVFAWWGVAWCGRLRNPLP